MHPRNIYKTPPSFSELGKLFPEFSLQLVCNLIVLYLTIIISKIFFQGSTGKIDFKNPAAVRSLTKCCLLKDFDLNVQLPENKLSPTLPLRLNYIHWIEDLLHHVGITENVAGIDIGCGASCIYSLLAVRLNDNWKMSALEIDNDNLKFAKENVSTNRLDENISVVDQEGSSSIFDKLLASNPQQKSFCMCNPPFFSSPDEVFQSENRTGNRKRPRSQNSGTPSELIFEDGGELGFVKKILNESVQLKEKVQIYTTMLGCKKNVPQLVDEIRKRNIESVTTTEFIQGKTTRWGVAWSVIHELRTFEDSVLSFRKVSASTNVLTHEIPTKDFEATVTKLKTIFQDLRVQIKVIEEKSEQCCRWTLIADENTWSNQRRKRRAAQRQTSSSEATQTKQDLQVAFELRYKSESAHIRMFYISGSMSKDCPNQILQFIKNKLK